MTLHLNVEHLRRSINKVGRIRKLSDEQIDEVRRLHKEGVSLSKLAEQFNVCKTTICKYL